MEMSKKYLSTKSHATGKNYDVFKNLLVGFSLIFSFKHVIEFS